MLTRDQAIAEIRAAKNDPERLATLELPDDQDVRRYLFDVCSLDDLGRTLFERTKDRSRWARFQLESFALGGMVLASTEMCDWDRTRHEWALRPGWKGVEIWEEEAKRKGRAVRYYEAPRKALEAKEKWLRGEIGDKALRKAREAAYAAYAASYDSAAYAAYVATAASASAAYDAASADAAGRDRWYLDYIRFLVERCNKEFVR